MMKLCLLLANFLLTFKVLAAPVEIEVAPLEDFSGLSKDEILQKRQKAVETSPLFNLLGGNYKPNPNVYQIQDKAPWISAHQISCYGNDTKNISQGVSRESLGILNPELLLHLEILSYRFHEKGLGCSSVDYLTPYKITYDEDENLIKAYIDYSSFVAKNKHRYNVSLMNANAHDLGYNYIFATMVDKSYLLPATSYSENLKDDKPWFKWISPINMTNSIVQARGYYHLGRNVCKHLGGCNNYSPQQPEYDFYFVNYPFEIHFKLWKNMPNAVSDTPDISYHLIFE